jgi:DNA mismatch endonuclease, patch repair protein
MESSPETQMDKLSPDARSKNMSRIRNRNTSPELIVRRYLHRKGLRFRVHARNLPGKPDLVFSGHRDGGGRQGEMGHFDR